MRHGSGVSPSAYRRDRWLLTKNKRKCQNYCLHGRFSDLWLFNPAGFGYDNIMTNEAERLMAEALKRVKLGGSFDPEQLGAKIGLNKPQAESAARALSNAGVLVLGFDLAAHFSPAFKKSHKPADGDADARVKAKRLAKRAGAKGASRSRQPA